MSTPTHTPAVNREGNSPQCHEPCCAPAYIVNRRDALAFVTSRLCTSDGQQQLAEGLAKDWSSSGVRTLINAIRAVGCKYSDPTSEERSLANCDALCDSPVIVDAIIDLILHIPIEEDARPAYRCLKANNDPALFIDCLDALYRIIAADNVAGLRRSALKRLGERSEQIFAKLFEARELWLGAARSMAVVATLGRELGVVRFADMTTAPSALPVMLHLYADRGMQTDGHAFLMATAIEHLCFNRADEPPTTLEVDVTRAEMTAVLEVAARYSLFDRLASSVIHRMQRSLESTWDHIDAQARFMLQIVTIISTDGDISGVDEQLSDCISDYKQALVSAGFVTAACSLIRRQRTTDMHSLPGAARLALSSLMPELSYKQRVGAYQAGYIELFVSGSCAKPQRPVALTPDLTELMDPTLVRDLEEKLLEGAYSLPTFGLCSLSRCAKQSEEDKQQLFDHLQPLLGSILCHLLTQRPALSSSSLHGFDGTFKLWQCLFSDVGLPNNVTADCSSCQRKCSAVDCDKTTADVKLFRCKACSFAAYCGAECQANDWQHLHRSQCKYLRM